MIQIPVIRKEEFGQEVIPTPWLLGGGTVRGVPEKDSLAAFWSTMRDGKVGTHVIMADGTVRFLVKGEITDAQFQSLCTLDAANKPTLDVLNTIAPVVYTPGKGPAIPPKGSGSSSGSGESGSGS